MQAELRIWLKRYPVPLMVSACDVAENLIEVNDGKNVHLVGWPLENGENIHSSWKLDDLSEFLKTAPPSPDWRTIYTDVGFRTGAQVKANPRLN